MFLYELIIYTKVNGNENKENELFSDYDLAIKRFYEMKGIVDSAEIYRYKEKDGKFISGKLLLSF